MTFPSNEPTILDEPSKFPNIPADEPLCIDIESTTFEDKIEKVRQFNSFLGPRVAGYAISTLDSRLSWFLPIRYRGEDIQSGDAHNCDIKPALAFIRELIGSGRDIVNHNIKFDARFWHKDGAWHAGELIDTMVLARLVDNTRESYSLGALSGEKTGGPIKAYADSLGTKDWGRIPIKLMAKYAENDARITAKLYHKLLGQLREESKFVWDTERKLTGHLAKAECHGIRVDKSLLKKALLASLKEMLELEERIHKMVGVRFDVGSTKEITKIMIGRLGVEPKTFTPTGRPKWDSVSLVNCGHPVGKLLARYSHLSHFSGTYCEGWLNRIGDDGRLHPKFNIAGTRTGRLSSSDPNFQNIPVEAEVFVLPDEGEVMVGADYSQFEYRLFGHYANDNAILGAYQKNPDTDFHQTLADMLGVERQFAKTLNFSFLYGLGKKKLLKVISGLLALRTDDEDMRQKMRDLVYRSGKASASMADAIDTDAGQNAAAAALYDEYHRMFPAIRQLNRRIGDAIRARGWLRNYMGRVYKMDERFLHKGLNYLIQGGTADMFKQRLLRILETVPYAKLITNVHDSMYFSVPPDKVKEFYKLFTKTMCNIDTPKFSEPLRVPLRADGKVSASHWGAMIEVESIDKLDEAIEKSKLGEIREWGQEMGYSDGERSTGHGTGVDWSKVDMSEGGETAEDSDKLKERKAGRQVGSLVKE